MGAHKRFLRLKKRQALLGALLFSAGVLMALGAIAVNDQLRPKTTFPLRPGNGDAQGSLTIEWLPETVKRWKPEIEKYGTEYGVDPNLIAIVMTIESGGDPNASSGVATGLMQITDPTAADINNRLISKDKKKTAYDLKDPDTSVEFGAVYLRHLVDQYGQVTQGPSWDETVSLVAAGYNGGFAAANLYRAEQWKGLDKYDQQTFNYTRFVRVMWQERHDPLSFTYRYWYETANGKALVGAAEKYSKS